MCRYVIKYMEDVFGLGSVIFLDLGHGNMSIHFLLFIKLFIYGTHFSVYMINFTRKYF